MQKKIRKQLIECTYNITQLLFILDFILSKLVPKLKSRKSSIIVLFDTQII